MPSSARPIEFLPSARCSDLRRRWRTGSPSPATCSRMGYYRGAIRRADASRRMRDPVLRIQGGRLRPHPEPGGDSGERGCLAPDPVLTASRERWCVVPPPGACLLRSDETGIWLTGGGARLRHVQRMARTPRSDRFRANPSPRIAARAALPFPPERCNEGVAMRTGADNLHAPR